MENDHAVRMRPAVAQQSPAVPAAHPGPAAPQRAGSHPAEAPGSTRAAAAAATGGSPGRARVTSVVAGTVAALAVWVVAAPVLGVELLTRTGPQGAVSTVSPAMVLVAGAVAGLAGWAALALLERLRATARRAWTLLAVAVTLVSLVGPFTSATTTAAALSLAVMHLAVGATLVPLLARTAEA